MEFQKCVYWEKNNEMYISAETFQKMPTKLRLVLISIPSVLKGTLQTLHVK